MAGCEGSTRTRAEVHGNLACMKRSMSAQLWQITTSCQSTQNGSTLTKHSREEPIQIRSRIVAREFKSGDKPHLYARTLPPEALKAIISTAASHRPEFSLMHVDVSRAYFHAKAQRSVLVKLPAEDCSGKDEGNIGILKKSMYGTRDAASNWERDWRGHLENWGYELGRSSRSLFHIKKRKNSGTR